MPKSCELLVSDILPQSKERKSCPYTHHKGIYSGGMAPLILVLNTR